MSDYKMNGYERETIITFNEAEDEAEIYTCSLTWMRRLDKLCENRNEISLKHKDKWSSTYICPKKSIKVRLPMQLDEEQRLNLKLRGQEKAKRLKEWRAEQLKSKEEVTE